MVTIQSLKFAYPKTDFLLAINDFRIAPEEKVAVIGPSGSGKTTLLNLLAGILVPDQGRVRCGDFEVSAMTDVARRAFRISHIGFVFQDFQLLDYLNVLDNVLHPYRISYSLKLTQVVRERAVDLLQQLGLGDKLMRSVECLSQGEKQRVAICRALLPSPDWVLADEPTGNIDPGNKERILDILFDIVEAHQATLLAVTHDHELLSRFDRTVDFNDFLT